MNAEVHNTNLVSNIKVAKILYNGQQSTSDITIDEIKWVLSNFNTNNEVSIEMINIATNAKLKLYRNLTKNYKVALKVTNCKGKIIFHRKYVKFDNLLQRYWLEFHNKDYPTSFMNTLLSNTLSDTFLSEMKTPINFVVTCYKKHKKLHWQQKYPLIVIEDALTAWCNFPNETIAIRTFYPDEKLLPAMPAAVDINLKKLTAKYKVRLTTNKDKYRTYKITYACLEDLIFSVINYLTITQETKMTYLDILTSGEN